MEKAKRDSWQITPIPETRKLLSFQRVFNRKEYNQLSFGLMPQAMEDKWFIFLENDQLFLHRSWTGYCIYWLQLKWEEQGVSVIKAWVNRDKKQYQSTDDEYDAELLSFLIDNLLLGKNRPFPQPSGLPKSAPKGLYQHHVAGTAYPETTITARVSLVERIKWFFSVLWH